MRLESTASRPEILKVDCCIVGGGPAGAMLGYLLARSGLDVAILEKYPDFFRDFRGDTIHPSTMEVMADLGLLERFLQIPHDELAQGSIRFGQRDMKIADFSTLPTKCKFIAFMPQWDFLNFLTKEGGIYPGFHMLMQHEGTDVLRDSSGKVAGVLAKTPQGMREIRAQLVVAADGRHSTIRERMGLAPEDFGAPIDVLWFRLSRRASDSSASFGMATPGRFAVMLARAGYWQIGWEVEKGSFPQMQAKGLDAFREEIATLVPFLRDRTHEIRGWDDVKLLTVMVNRLRQWYAPGVLLIGDSAHAMSPVGGVGINLAIQDAVASANILAPVLRSGSVGLADLAAVQKRREWPTRWTQKVQIRMHEKFLYPLLKQSKETKATPPLWMRLFSRFGLLRRIPARLMGMGLRPEHPDLRGIPPGAPIAGAKEEIRAGIAQ